MSSESGDSVNRASQVNVELCYCGVAAKLRTSWTDRNPGRRFVGCPAKAVSRTDPGHMFCTTRFFVHLETMVSKRSHLA